jgi:NTP pyrophosphatase (non-canonical NTP hydrolase)
MAPAPMSTPSDGAGPYSIGAGLWPGLSKLIEEAGEVAQVAGKIIGTGGELDHWDGTNLADRLEEELGDLSAAIDYVTKANDLDSAAIDRRAMAKLALFGQWHVEARRADNPLAE